MSAFSVAAPSGTLPGGTGAAPIAIPKQPMGYLLTTLSMVATNNSGAVDQVIVGST